MRRRGGLALVALVALLLAALGTGCGGPGPSDASPTDTPGSTAPASATLNVTPSPDPTLTATLTSSPIPSDATGALEDPALIAILPAEVAGNPVTLEPLAFAEAMADPGFAANIEAAAFGIVIAGNDLASAVVARPVDGAFTDAWFRDWRDSYNQGACDQAGGMAGNAEAELGGRTVHIGTCAGGLRTYHAWIEDGGLLVSAFSIGEGRFGEQLMAGLRP